MSSSFASMPSRIPCRTTSTAGQLSTKKDNLRTIQTAEKATPPQSKARSRAVGAVNTLAALSAPPFAPSPQWTRGQKRKAASLGDCPDKRLQKDTQSLSGSGHCLDDHASPNDCPAKQLEENRQFTSESSQPLTKENLSKLNRLTGSSSLDHMNPTMKSPKNDSRKRLSSRQSGITDDINQSITSPQSPKSSTTYAHYRWVVLDRARIFVCAKPPPEDVQTRINAVVCRKTVEGREKDLFMIAQQLRDGFVEVVSSARREDDSVELLHRALSSMNWDKKLEFPRKIDWNPVLKPEVPSQRCRRFPLPERSNDIADEPIDSPGKRRQLNTTSGSLEGTTFTMPPASLPLLQPRQENFILKTPRPDITMGLSHSALIESLVVAGVDVMAANDFVKTLEDQQTLCSDPSQEAINIRFPVLVVEGKSYSTGKFIFEAQNQAAVSGSCMMKMQHQLADLFDLIAPKSHDKKEPLAFSICNQGPYMELWAHYTTSVSGIRKYNMNLVQVCNALILDGVLDFLVIVDRVLSWACSEFVDNVAKQLALMENAT